MRGYGSTSYGDGFADVYDDWYAEVTDVEATVDRLRTLTVSRDGQVPTVLELGVGTGRLAFPLADAGLAVTGIDSSQAMLDRLHERNSDGRVNAVAGDMVDDLPNGPFDSALVAYNTLFNLLDDGAQAACFVAVARRLRPGGVFVVEAFVPETEQAGISDVSVRSMAVDRVVLSISQHSPADQRASGQFVEFTETGGVRLRPWAIKWATVEQLDAMARAAGFDVESRFASMTGGSFDDESTQHVTVYRLPK